jgi:hypothetical protein
VHFDRLHRDEERLSDLLVAHPVGRQLRHAPIARGERVRGPVRRILRGLAGGGDLLVRRDLGLALQDQRSARRKDTRRRHHRSPLTQHDSLVVRLGRPRAPPVCARMGKATTSSAIHTAPAGPSARSPTGVDDPRRLEPDPSRQLSRVVAGSVSVQLVVDGVYTRCTGLEEHLTRPRRTARGLDTDNASPARRWRPAPRNHRRSFSNRPSKTGDASLSVEHRPRESRASASGRVHSG